MSRRATYLASGVSFHRANRLIQALKPLARSTRRAGVVGAVGGFGGLFDLKRAALGPKVLLVASADGVGSKLTLAKTLARYEGLGVDLVAMNVNDLICSGASPLFFLDYIATHRIEQKVLVPILKGVARGCRESHCALLGGETAEMPSCYRRGDFDLAGFAVGAVSKQKLLSGKKIRPGDALIGLASSGLHSNGFTLVQRVLSKRQLKSLGSTLLKPTRIYVRPVQRLLGKVAVKGLAHITGGSFEEKLVRILPKRTAVEIKRRSWRVPQVFRTVQAKGKVSEAEMYKTFNMGVGLVAVVAAKDVAKTLRVIKSCGVPAWKIGEVVRGTRKVIWK